MICPYTNKECRSFSPFVTSQSIRQNRTYYKCRKEFIYYIEHHSYCLYRANCNARKYVQLTLDF